jgi:hypothetical protein
MIRIQESAGWLLTKHRDHARPAGDFVRHRGNADSAPSLTRAGLPAAFTRERVGAKA